MPAPTSAEIRQAFLDFFREKGHEIVPSAPLVPQDDPTLLFINAGMNPFKDVFLGTGSRPYTRVSDTQKCLRVSGKHNDLEEVGLDTYHHTFFEMLGNWSFGDYFKAEAIAWAWELLVERWGLDPGRLYATVHEGDAALGLEADTEAADLWKTTTSIPHDHVLYQGSKDNFWMMGDTGPCGPCSEIHVDLRPDAERAATPGAALVNTDDPRVMEIWNLVFIQYNAQADGSLEPLAAKHVDTGMGFERLCAVLQGKSSNYDTDLFAPILAAVAARAGVGGYDELDESDEDGRRKRIAMRVVADHLRTIAFAIADGAQPGNAGRGYVIRRILRRAVRFGYQSLGIRSAFLADLVPVLAKQMATVFPELRAQEDYVVRVVRGEEEAFLRTLDGGLSTIEGYLDFWNLYRSEVGWLNPEHGKMGMIRGYGYDGLPENKKDPAVFEKYGLDFSEQAYRVAPDLNIDRAMGEAISNASDDWFYGLPRSGGGFPGYGAFSSAYDSDDDLKWATIRAALRNWLPGEIVFLLHDTYGFPADLTALMARERGLDVDTARFDELMAEQRDRARAAAGFAVDNSQVDVWRPTGAERDPGTPAFVGYDALAVDGARILKTRSVGTADDARHELVLDTTPFYAESGGQVGDTGTLAVGGETIAVLDTVKDAEGQTVHVVERLPADPAAPVHAAVDADRRARIVRHHSATHLLHAALREALGTHVQQKGSLVAPDRLRFDFAHFERVTPEQLRAIEQRVNALVLRNIPKGEDREVPLDEARARGAMALFGEKYGETVRVITFDPAVSVELCGGVHAASTGEIGLFRITGEGSVASGIRRIEAVAGEAALAWLDDQMTELDAARGRFKQLPDGLAPAIAALQDEVRAAQRDLAALRAEAAAAGLDAFLAAAQDIDGIRVVTGRVDGADMNALRDLADEARTRLGTAGVAVFGSADDAEGKAFLAASVTDDLVRAGVQAGRLVGALAKRVGGGGGGKPHLATAGGKDPAALGEALAAVPDEVRALR